MSALKVSVVIPCYNAAATIGRLLRQLDAQTLPTAQREIIIIDDGSTDDTVALIEQHGGVELLRQDRRGPGVGRNRGMAQARGELILFIDSDLEVAPDLLEQHLQYHTRHPDVAATGGSVEAPGKLPLFSWVLADHFASWFNVHPDYRYPKRPEYLPGLNFCIKHAVVDNYQLTWPDGIHHTGEDVVFCYEMRRQNLRIKFVPEAVVRHHDRTTLEAYARHMFRWGFHAPYVRGSLPGLGYGYLFPRHLSLLPLTLPLIVLGYTWLIWISWLGSRPLAVTCAIPQLLVGRFAYAWGVLKGTANLRREQAATGPRRAGAVRAPAAGK